MKRFYAITLYSFIALSIFTLFINFFAQKGLSILIYSFFAFSLNLSLAFLLIFILWRTKIYEKKYFEPLFFVFLSCFILAYIIDSILFVFVKNYLSGTSISYIVSFLDIFLALLSGILLLFLILALAEGLHKVSRRKSKEFNGLNSILIFFIFFCLFASFAFSDEISQASPISKGISSTVSSLSNYFFHGERITIVSSEFVPILNNSFKNPNIILVIIDAVSVGHVQCYGYNRDVTPNIDWFCNNSLVFENAYSSASHTELSQTSILSSLQPLRYELRDSFEENYPRKFIWDSLKEEGYKTAYFSSENDEWMNMIEFYNKTNLDFYSHSLSDGKTDYGIEGFRKDYDETTVNSAIRWIGNSSKFFLMLGFHSTHYPYEYPPQGNRFFVPDEPSIFSSYLKVIEGDEVSDLNRYDNALRYADKQVGVLKKFLEEKGLMNNTIIVIASDHGESLNYSEKEFRHGNGVSEEEIHVPLLVYLPNQGKKIIEERVTLLDLVPTLLNISGYNDFGGFQGKPFSKNRTLFFMTQSYNFKIGMIKGDFKYIINMNDYSYEAYNLLNDPQENNNLVKFLSKNDIPKNILDGFSELLAWHDCQVEYYEDRRYERGEILSCG